MANTIRDRYDPSTTVAYTDMAFASTSAPALNSMHAMRERSALMVAFVSVTLSQWAGRLMLHPVDAGRASACPMPCRTCPPTSREMTRLPHYCPM